MGRLGEAPTAEDLFATARCLCVFCARRPGLDAQGLARRLVARAGIARAYRKRNRRAHPRFGDGSLSAASALALTTAWPRVGERTGRLGFLAALAATIGAVESADTHASS